MDSLKENKIEENFIDVENEFGNKLKIEVPEKILEEFKDVDLENKENKAMLISNLLKRCEINKTEVARLLEIDHRSISRLLKLLE